MHIATILAVNRVRAWCRRSLNERSRKRVRTAVPRAADDRGQRVRHEFKQFHAGVRWRGFDVG